MRTLTGFHADPDTLDRAVANCAGVYRVWAERMGKRSRLWEDVSCADLELPVALPPNIAVVLRRPSGDEADTLPERVAGFFSERPGGPYGIRDAAKDDRAISWCRQMLWTRTSRTLERLRLRG